MQSAPLVVCKVVTLVVRNEIDDRPLRESGRLVKNKPALLYTRL